MGPASWKRVKGLWQYRGPRRSVCSETPSPAPAQEVAAWSTRGFGSLGRDSPTAHQALPGLKPPDSTQQGRGETGPILWMRLLRLVRGLHLTPLSLRSSAGEDQEPRHELWDTGHLPTICHLTALLTGCPQGPGGVEGSCGGSPLLAASLTPGSPRGWRGLLGTAKPQPGPLEPAP